MIPNSHHSLTTNFWHLYFFVVEKSNKKISTEFFEEPFIKRLKEKIAWKYPFFIVSIIISDQDLRSNLSLFDLPSLLSDPLSSCRQGEIIASTQCTKLPS